MTEDKIKFAPAEIVENSPYKDVALIEEQDKIVEALVYEWNSIISEYENKTIMFALKVKELMKGYPDSTISEIIDKVRNHPSLKQKAHSKDRIMQGLRLMKERPELLETKPMSWEFYFQLYKWNIDPGLRLELEEKGIEEKWSTRKLKAEMIKLQEEKENPNTFRRFQKQSLIRELVFMCKDLQPDDMRQIRKYVVDNFKEKLIRWNRYMKNLEVDVNEK